MQDTTMANILNEAKMVKKNDAKFNYDMKKTIIISLQLSTYNGCENQTFL